MSRGDGVVDLVVRRHSANAAMRMLAGNVLLLRMAGPLTRAALAGFAEEAVAAHGHQAVGFVLDYRTAVLAAGPDDLKKLLGDVPRSSPLRRPGAFVCTEDQEATLRCHAMQMAAAGFKRRLFDEVERAHVWVIRSAESWPG